MRARSVLVQSLERLRLAGCPYRFRVRSESPHLTVYETQRGGRTQTAKGFSADDDESVFALTQLLLDAQANLKAGGSGLDWTRLSGSSGTPSGTSGQTWGEIRRLILADIAPGGPKARDRNPFVCFSNKGYFGRAFPDQQIARPEHLELFCLNTPASIEANRADPKAHLVPRNYNTSGFYGVIQMVRYLAKKGVAIATPELCRKLEGLKSAAGRTKAPAPRFIPRTSDVQSWLDQLQPVDPLRGWVMAMIATYGLRPHEVWHIERLPGEGTENPTFIEISVFEESGGSSTKTGHRFALPLPEEWLDRYRLRDLAHSRAMLAELRRRHPIKTADSADGGLQFWNNTELGRVVVHWLRNSGREDRELPIKLFGYHQPRHVPGQPQPRAIRGRCKCYDLRHAWAIRARETTTWSTTLKAASMGHSESIHAKRYLAELTAVQRERGMARQKAHDESTTPSRLSSQPKPQ